MKMQKLINLIKISAILFFVFSFSKAFALGAEDMFWLKPPEAHPKYEFFVGQGSSQTSEEEALKLAKENAFEKIITENFGLVIQVKSSIQSNLNSVTLNKNTTVNSPKFNTVGLSEDKQYVLKEKNTFQAYVLYKYDKKALMREKIRMSSLSEIERTGEAGSNIQYASKNKLLNKKFGSLHIKALHAGQIVDGAALYINGQLFGETPAELNGRLKVGSHHLKIVHPVFENWSQVIQINATETTVLDVELNPLLGSVNFETDPEEVKVFYNGQFKCSTPCSIDNLTSLKLHSFKLEKKGYGSLSISDYMVNKKNVHPTLKFALQKNTLDDDFDIYGSQNLKNSFGSEPISNRFIASDSDTEKSDTNDANSNFTPYQSFDSKDHPEWIQNREVIPISFDLQLTGGIETPGLKETSGLQVLQGEVAFFFRNKIGISYLKNFASNKDKAQRDTYNFEKLGLAESSLQIYSLWFFDKDNVQLAASYGQRDSLYYSETVMVSATESKTLGFNYNEILLGATFKYKYSFENSKSNAIVRLDALTPASTRVYNSQVSKNNFNQNDHIFKLSIGFGFSFQN